MRPGYTVEVTSNQAMDLIAGRVAGMAKALDEKLEASDIGGEPAPPGSLSYRPGIKSREVPLRTSGRWLEEDERLLLQWIGEQENAHSKSRIRTNGPLPSANRNAKALERLEKKDEIEYRPTEYIGSKSGKTKTMQGAYVTKVVERKETR